MHRRALAIFLLLSTAGAARAAIWEQPLGPYGTFRLDVPSGWTARLQGPDAPGGRAVAITPPGAAPLLVLVSTYPLPDNAAAALLDDGARSTVARLQRVAEETALVPRWFETPIGRGFYVSVTDRRVAQPTAGDFKYGIQGQLVTGRVFATFSIFTNLASGPEREQALEMVRAAWHEPSAMPVPDNGGTVSLALPDRAWRLLIDLPGFTFGPKQSLPARARLAGANASTAMNLSVFLEAAAPGRTAVDYREQLWARTKSTGPFIDVRRSERDGMALLERTFPGAAGVRIDQRHVNALVVRDGVWLDVHLSKPRYTPQDDPLFEAIIRTVRFADKGIADLDYDAAVLRLEPSTSLAYLGRAGVHFKRGDYDKAIADFSQVVRLQPDFAGSYKGRALAYRRKGELDRAIADYDQIVRLEPNNTLGYFGRGSLHHERGDLDRAIADYDDVVRLDPKHVLAYEQRGRAHEQKGERDRAIADYRMVLALVSAGPAHQRARDALARLGASP